MTPSPNEVERLADAATREIHGDDYRIATRLIIAKALRDVLRSVGREYVSVPVAFVKAAHDYINSRGDSMDNRMTIEATPLTAAPPAPNRDAEDAKVDAAAWVYRYGTHRTSCSWRKPPQSNFQKQVCDCGLDELKKRVRTIYTESKHD